MASEVEMCDEEVVFLGNYDKSNCIFVHQNTPYRFTVHRRISERHCTSDRTHFWGKICEIVVSILHVFVL